MNILQSPEPYVNFLLESFIIQKAPEFGLEMKKKDFCQPLCYGQQISINTTFSYYLCVVIGTYVSVVARFLLS